MGRLDTLFRGRPNGVRARVRAMFGGGDATPAPPPAPPVEPAERALGLKVQPPRDVTPPEGFEVVLHKDALESGRIIEIIVGGTSIAVANVGGAYHAISNVCAHAQGPLGEGTVDGCAVTCPYHGWSYDLRDGRCLTMPGRDVAVYPVQIVGDAVCVRI